MGMFDRLIVLGGSRLLCGAGHPQHDFQSKDLSDCPSMDEYLLFEGRLYRSAREERVRQDASLREGSLVLRWEQTAAAVELTGAVCVYTNCDDCEPVYFERSSSLAWDAIDQRAPWVEYELTFERGALVNAEAPGSETRETLRAKLLADGVHVLPDDDRIVRRARALRAKR